MIFGRAPTAEEITEGIDLSGKSVVLTGVNSGLGAETMRVLSLRGAHVFGLARTLEKAREACSAVPGSTTALECELGDWQSVRTCAEAIKADGQPIDVLIANAGIMAPKELVLHHGLESTFAINHMGHFVLAHHLLEQVRRADRGRIVLVSSDAHKVFVTSRTGVEFDALDGSKGNRPWKFYGQSKLANVLHAKALAARLEGSGGTANALHPGVIRTGLAQGFRVCQQHGVFPVQTDQLHHSPGGRDHLLRRHEPGTQGSQRAVLCPVPARALQPAGGQCGAG